MAELNIADLSWSVQRLPSNLKNLMKEPEWENSLFVGGGYIRCVITGDKINDIDLFVKSEKDAELVAFKLAKDKKDIHKSPNAFTVKGKTTIQVIHRWLFHKPEDVALSFDFTICCAVISYSDKKWKSFCDDRYYMDLASKRLIYRSPVRNEDAGGSMLRVLKYYQKGYRIPIDSLGSVIARLVKDIDTNKVSIKEEKEVGKILTGLLRVVDPNIDPLHESHLPSQSHQESSVKTEDFI